jgi:tetratricopeptide (TPR) repeat protein
MIGLMVCLAAATGAARPQSGRVAGIVRNTEGEPIRGATIVAENSRAEPHSFTVTTDERGRFVITGLQGGAWQFLVSAPGYASHRQETDVSALRGKAGIEISLARSAAVGAGPLAGANARNVQADLQAANALLEGGQYDQAIAIYQAVLARVPALTTINLQIGNGYRLKKDYDRAVAFYQILLKTDPGNERVKVAIATAYLEKGDPKAAEDALGSPTTGTASRDVAYMMGEITLAQKQPDVAAVWYGKAAELDPGWTRPLLRLGLIAFDKGDKETAMKHLEKVVAADPNSPEAAQAKVILERLK